MMRRRRRCVKADREIEIDFGELSFEAIQLGSMRDHVRKGAWIEDVVQSANHLPEAGMDRRLAARQQEYSRIGYQVQQMGLGSVQFEPRMKPPARHASQAGYPESEPDSRGQLRLPA